jgi:hypothetical protein
MNKMVFIMILAIFIIPQVHSQNCIAKNPTVAGSYLGCNMTNVVGPSSKVTPTPVLTGWT